MITAAAPLLLLPRRASGSTRRIRLWRPGTRSSCRRTPRPTRPTCRSSAGRSTSGRSASRYARLACACACWRPGAGLNGSTRGRCHQPHANVPSALPGPSPPLIAGRHHHVGPPQQPPRGRLAPGHGAQRRPHCADHPHRGASAGARGRPGPVARGVAAAPGRRQIRGLAGVGGGEGGKGCDRVAVAGCLVLLAS